MAGGKVNSSLVSGTKARTAEKESCYVLLGELSWWSNTSINSSPEHDLLGWCEPQGLVAASAVKLWVAECQPAPTSTL